MAVACERKPRWITCPYGTRIKIHSANYGRTDVRTCLSRSIKNINCYAKLYAHSIAFTMINSNFPKIQITFLYYFEVILSLVLVDDIMLAMSPILRLLSSIYSFQDT